MIKFVTVLHRPVETTYSADKNLSADILWIRGHHYMAHHDADETAVLMHGAFQADTDAVMWDLYRRDEHHVTYVTDAPALGPLLRTVQEAGADICGIYADRLLVVFLASNASFFVHNVSEHHVPGVLPVFRQYERLFTRS